MSSAPFFAQLRREFKNDPYRDRFLAELQDHSEDLAESENMAPESLTSTFMQKHFGDPKQVKKDFVSITRPWQKWLEVGEALGYGALRVFVLMLAPALLDIAFQRWYGVFSFTQALPFQALALSGLLLLIYFFLWRFALSRKYDFLSRKSLLGLSLGLQAAFLFLSAWNLYRRWSLFGDINEPDFYPTLALLSIAMDWLAFWLAARRPCSSFAKAANGLRLQQAFGLLAFGYVLAYSAFRAIRPAFNFEPYMTLGEARWWEILLQPIHYAEKIFLIDLPSALFVSIPWAHYLQIVLVIGLLGWSIGYFLHQKRASWFASAVALYVLAILFVPGGGFYQDPKNPLPSLRIHVPSVSVSQKIEKTQYGLFYGMVRYLEARSVDQVAYLVEPHGDQFAVRQFGVSGGGKGWERLNSEPALGQDFLFDPYAHSLESLQGFDFQTPVVGPKNKPSFRWPEGWSCEIDGHDAEKEEFDDWGICQRLLFRGRAVLEMENGQIKVEGFAFSPDRSLLLLSFQDYPKSSVYLLDFSAPHSAP